MTGLRAPFVFIASPLNHSSADIVAQRANAAAHFGAWIMEHEDKNVFVAAVQDVALRQHMKSQKGLDWWSVNMETFMEPAEACYVLNLEGWETSKGVALETEVARRLGKPIFHYVQSENGYKRT